MKKLSTTGLQLLLILVFSFSAFAADIDAPYGEELWKFKTEKKILWQELTDCGFLVVCTADALYCLNPETGEEQWRNEEFRKLADDYFEVIPNTQFAAIVKKQGALGMLSRTVIFDIIEGKELWSTDKFEMANSQGQFFIPQYGAFLLHGTNAKGKPVTALAGLADGEPVWTSGDLFKATGKHAPHMFVIREGKKSGRMGIGGNQFPLVTPDDNFLEYFSMQGLRKIDSNTGDVLWTWDNKTKNIPALRVGYGAMLLNEDGSVVYVPHEGTLLAVNTADGTLTWGPKTKPKLNGAVQQMALTPQGLVVKGWGKKPFLNVLDPATGETVWRKPFRKLDDASSFDIEGDRIVLYANRSLLSVGIADGEVTEIAKKIKFEGKEVPQNLEVKEGGYLLTSTNNLAMYDKAGNQLWHSYYKAPGSSMLGKIASTAVITAVNAASAADGYSRAQANASRSGTGRGEASYSMITSNPIMSKRLKASTESNNFLYILTNIEGGSSGSTANAGLVKVNKSTGNTDARVALGTKKPEYEVDSIENRIFFKSENDEITCYSL